MFLACLRLQDPIFETLPRPSEVASDVIGQVQRQTHNLFTLRCCVVLFLSDFTSINKDPSSVWWGLFPRNLPGTTQSHCH